MFDFFTSIPLAQVMRSTVLPVCEISWDMRHFTRKRRIYGEGYQCWERSLPNSPVTLSFLSETFDYCMKHTAAIYSQKPTKSLPSCLNYVKNPGIRNRFSYYAFHNFYIIYHILSRNFSICKSGQRKMDKYSVKIFSSDKEKVK